MKRQLLFFILILLPVVASADAVEIDGIFYNLYPSVKQAEVTTNPNKYTGEVIIPESLIYEGTEYNVTAIGDYAFGSCYELTSITIPFGVKYIGVRAFEYCDELLSVCIPPSLTEIGSYAFNNPTKIIKISDLEAWCNIIINDGNFNSPHQLYLNDVEIKDLVIPEGLTTISNRIFSNCSSLLSVTIPNSINEIGDSVFMNCENLQSAVLGYGLQKINNYTFFGCKNLDSVFIPNSVQSIGKSSFENCISLKNEIIPNSVRSIGSQAFSGCSSLISIYISPNVNEIGTAAFSGCYGLTSITVDNGNLNYDSRYNCNAIIETETNALIAGCKTSTIPNSIQGIGGYAFKDCKGLTTVTIPKTVTTIGGGAFEGCTSLTTIEIPNSVTYIIGSAFSGCTSLSSIELPNSITYIGNNAFQNCKNLTLISIPNSVTYIGQSAFWGCLSLAKVALPNNISEVMNTTFYCCLNLESVIIPKRVTKIGTSAFDGCPALSNVFCFAEEVPETNSGSFNIPVLDNNKTLHVPANSIDKYKSAYQWSKFGNIVALTDEELSLYGNSQENTKPDNNIEGIYLTEPNSYRIYNGENKTYGSSPEIIIIDNGDGKYYVDDLLGGYYSQCRGYGPNYAMTGNIIIEADGTVSLKDSHVNGWDDGLARLTGTFDATTSTFTIEAEYVSGMRFFQTWVKHSNVFTNEGIHYKINENNTVSVVKGNYSGDIVIPDQVLFNGITYSVTSIDEAFRWCRGVTSVTIPSSIKSFAYNAFEGCTGLISVTIPNSVTSIGDEAFYGCTGLTSIKIPNSVISIGQMVFAYCDRLSDLILSDNLTTIGQSAFIACNCLKSLVIPKNVLKIGNRAFTECESLESIIVDSENIKYDSRNNCNAIIETYTNRLILGCENTVIPDNVTTIGGGAFSGSIGMKSLLIPNSVTSIENGAFRKCKGLNSLRIGNNVEIIKSSAFNECSGLQSIIIPEKTKEIGGWAFSKCTELKDVYNYAEAIPITDVETFSETPIETATLHVPAASIEVYKTTVPWNRFGKIVALTDDDPKPTNVQHLIVEYNNKAEEFYTIDGKRLSKPQRGLNIFRMSNGKNKKVLIK